MEPITIAYFKAFTPQGEELYSLFKTKMSGYILRGHPVKILEQTTYNMMTSILACLNYDVVIFDGSIEDDVHTQYRAAIELMKGLDHVLIVSRTFLPFNFEGMRKGGAPSFISTGTTEYSGSMNNAEILEWIIDTLEHSSMELPRRLRLNMNEQECRKNPAIVQKIEGQMIQAASERKEINQGIFVSYLSRYSKAYQGQHPDVPCVEEVFDLICRTNDVRMKDILYFPPGRISLEFMTEQRRFEIAHSTENVIVGCKAFWIYETPDYYSSWWTYGERLSLVHSFGHVMEKCPDIYVVKPYKAADGNWSFSLQKYLSVEEKREFLPKLTADQAIELHNLYINSNSSTVGYEQVSKMRALAQMPTPLLRMHLNIEKFAFLRQMELIIDNLPMDDEEKQMAFKEMEDTDSLIKSIRAYGYSKKFWENHIVECPFCRVNSKKAVNLEQYMFFKSNRFYSFSPRQYDAVRNTVKAKGICNFRLPCGHEVSLGQSDFVYYRWWTVKSDVPTGPNGALLEKIDTISFSDV